VEKSVRPEIIGKITTKAWTYGTEKRVRATFDAPRVGFEDLCVCCEFSTGLREAQRLHLSFCSILATRSIGTCTRRVYCAVRVSCALFFAESSIKG